MVNPVPGYGVSTPYGQRGPYWGCKPDAAGNGIHTGVDYAAPAGAKCVAARDGTVRYVNCGSAFGTKQLAIVSGGSRDFYAHMRKRSVADGAKVKAGDKVGEVGAEGNVTGPHLHFERHNCTSCGWSCGIIVDPAPSINYKASSGGGSEQQGDDDVPKYARATYGGEMKLKGGADWSPISWDNPTNNKDVFSKGNPGIDLGANGATYDALLTVSFKAGDKVGNYFTQAIEGNFQTKDNSWQITQSLPGQEVAGTGGGQTVQHVQIQSLAKGDKLRFRVKASQDCTVTGASITILYW